MPAIAIPSRYHGALTAIRDLPPSVAEKLTDSLAEPIPADIATLAAAVVARMPPDGADVSKIFDVLLSLAVALYQSDADAGVFVHDVVRAMNESGEAGLAVAPDTIPKMEARLLRLLQAPALKVVAKAIGLRSDFANTFFDAKILTDIRPVFDVDPSHEPLGAIITHTLKVEYNRGAGKHEEFYVGLAPDDLKALLETLERARIKGNTLRALLEKSGTADLDRRPE